MKVKYNRLSTIIQTGARLTLDKDHYDLVLLDKISGTVPFKDRPKAKILVKLIEEGKVTDLVLEEFSRIGRNTADVITNLDWLDSKDVNVIVRNLGLQSRPNGVKNPIWKMISSVMSSMYEMELENIKERTMAGRAVYVQNGGILGRPAGSNESEHEFLKKGTSIKIIKALENGQSVRYISKNVGVSTSTVMKVKALKEKINPNANKALI